MPISLINFDTASEEVKKVWTEHENRGYRMTNMKRTLLHSVTAFRSLEDGYYGLQESLETFLDQKTVVFFGYAVSLANDCVVCEAYFKNILDAWDVDFDTHSFNETEELLIKAGRELAANKGYLSEETRAALSARFDEKQVVELISFAVMMTASNFFNNALDVQSELL